MGHYAGQAVGLPVAQQKILAEFYQKLNYDSVYRHLPMVVYYDYQRRRAVCAGAADRHVYVDTDGQLHACSLWRKPADSVLDNDLKNTLHNLRQAGCLVMDYNQYCPQL